MFSDLTAKDKMCYQLFP